jgi:hypothetical protein
MNCSHTHPTRRIQHLVAAFLLVGFLPAIFPHTARADVVIPVARVECIPEFGIVTVSEESIRGKRVLRSLEEQPEEIANRYGIHDVSSYFIFEGEDEDPPKPRIIGSRTKTVDCQLPDHLVSIAFEPSIARPCPSAVTIRLTVRIDGTLIVENLKYWRSCLHRDTVSSFQFNEDGEFIFLRGGFDDARKDELGVDFVENFSLVYQLDEFDGRYGTLSPLKTFEDVAESYKRRETD